MSFLLAQGLDAVVPLTLGVVPHIGALHRDERSNATVAGDFSRLVILPGRGPLRAHLNKFARGLSDVTDIESLAQIAGHRLLTINMHAGIHRIDGDGSVPMVNRGHPDRIHVLHLVQKALMLREALTIRTNVFLRHVNAGLRNVADRKHFDVVVTTMRLEVADVGVETLTTDTDDGGVDPVICTDDPSRRRRLALTINGRFERVHGGHCGGCSCGFLDESTACTAVLRRLPFVGLHNA